MARGRHANPRLWHGLLILLPQHVRGEAVTTRAKIRLRHSCDTSTHTSPSIGTSRNPLPDQTPPYTRTNVVKRAQRPRCADIMREDRAVVWSCVVALVALPLVVSACLGDYEQCSSGACVLYAPDCGKYVAHARGPEARGSLLSPLCIACVARCTDSLGGCVHRCTAGQYLCPDRTTCVDGAGSYLTCPGITGTHLDPKLSLDARLDYLVGVATHFSSRPLLTWLCVCGWFYVRLCSCTMPQVAHTNLTQQIAQLTNEGPALPDLGIPMYNWLNDDEHGVKQAHATSFPNGCNLGASWDKKLLGEVGLAIGVEARGGYNGFVNEGNRGMPMPDNGVGITLYSPNLNVRHHMRVSLYLIVPCPHRRV